MTISLKKLGARAAFIIFLYAWMELLSFAGYYFYDGKLFSFSRYKQSLSKAAEVVFVDNSNSTTEIDGDRTDIRSELNPFLAFGLPEGLKNPGVDIINYELARNSVRVLILGGSVAMELVQTPSSRDLLVNRLQQLPIFKGKKVEIVLLALKSYREPQQVISLVHYLIFGGKGDIVINIDGHNDLVDGELAYKDGIFYGYPYLWRDLHSSYMSQEAIRQAGAIIEYRQSKQQVASRFLHSPLKYSVTAALFWDAYNRHHIRTLQGLRQDYKKFSSKYTNDEAFTGPYRTYDEKTRLDLYIYTWLNGSAMLNSIAQLYHMDYFHFLQPNPYMPNSKPLTEDELKMLADAKDDHSQEKTSYRRLEKEGENLQKQNIKFYSLVDIFKQTQETVYVDEVGHVNREGNDMLANAIADKLIQYYNKNPRAF